jgi:fructose-bisphosphate aldolase class I
MWGTETGPLGHPEVATKGLDDLQERAAEAYAKGCRFAKWRNVLQLDPEKGLPSDLAIQDTVHTLARYASICQSEGLCPIVEPEVVPNGKHDIYYCQKMTEKVLAAQFKALN